MTNTKLPEDISFVDAEKLVLECNAKYWVGVNPYLLYFDEAGKIHTYIRLSLAYIKLE